MEKYLQGDGENSTDCDSSDNDNTTDKRLSNSVEKFDDFSDWESSEDEMEIDPKTGQPVPDELFNRADKLFLDYKNMEKDE